MKRVAGSTWPMADGGARGRCRALRPPCGASGTRYVSMRGLSQQQCALLAYGLWCAIRRYPSATRLCGASGTRYMRMRDLTGSRRVPSGKKPPGSPSAAV
eukprot:4509257-Prymnesium_polylepis.1